jgi:hypothetical protein
LINLKSLPASEASQRMREELERVLKELERSAGDTERRVQESLA